MAKQYYTLAVRECGQWAPQFGDYDRQTVADELQDYRDHDYKRKDLRIVKSGASQAEIMAAVNALQN